MALVPRNNNINTNSESNEQASGSFFPKTNARSTGQGFTNQNRRVGEFKGKLKALRPIRSRQNPTVFAVIDIEVPGEQGVFQDYLNFNPNKDAQSMSYLVNHTKSLIASAGYESTDEEQGMDWVEATIKELVDNGVEITFNQSRNQNGLSINYL